MKLTERIFVTTTADGFIGRGGELQRLLEQTGRSGILRLGAPPMAGTSELLKQAFDRLFAWQDAVVPVYFAIDAAENASQAATRFARIFLAQLIAFRQKNAALARVGVMPAGELISLARDEDKDLAQRLASLAADSDGTDAALAAPFIAESSGLRSIIFIDDIHLTAEMDDGRAFLTDLKDRFENSTTPVVLAGYRRFDASIETGERLDIDLLERAAAAEIARRIAADGRIEIDEATSDLAAEQLGRRPVLIKAVIAAAARDSRPLTDFAAFQQVYTDELFGLSIGRRFARRIDSLAPDAGVDTRISELIGDTIDAGRTSSEQWQREAGLAADDLEYVLERLNTYEFIDRGYTAIHAAREDLVLTDHIRSRRRLESGREPRALIVGETLQLNLRRGPRLLAREYRRQAAIGLRSVLERFDGRQVAAASLAYPKFRSELKGLEADLQLARIAATGDRMPLPRVLFAVQTEDLYPPFADIVDRERSAAAFAVDHDGEDVVWVAAEIDSKLEVPLDRTEYWLDRLEMAAVSCGAERYTLWLIAPEGFSPEACAAIAERNAVGSSRRQLELLGVELDLRPPANDGAAKQYDLVIPINGDTELVAANMAEEIAQRSGFTSRDINQIKTALVEACINAAEHSLSPDRKLAVTYRVRSGEMTIIVSNRGLRLQDRMPAPKTSDTERRGWGLELISRLMDEVEILPTDDGTRISMKKRAAQASQ